MSRTYCHTHSAYDCQTCADEILSLGIQVDKDRIAALELENKELRANAARFLRLAQRVPEKKPLPDLLLTELRKAKGRNACVESKIAAAPKKEPRHD